jgi:lysyl-tRNA synthetase class 2
VTTGAEQPEPDDRSGRSLDALMAERRAKRDALAAAGVDPYPARFDRTDLAADLRRRFAHLGPDDRTGVEVAVAGRMTARRGHGKLVFATLTDVSGAVQLLVQVADLDEPSAAVLEACDLGDWIGATGEVMTSRRGELSVGVRTLVLLAKAVRPLPDKWHGLSEADTRYRQRELDLLANPETRRVFDIRFATIAAMRQALVDEHFVEVETPILQAQAGGAIARPFVTHANTLDVDLRLRIAPEIYLKRLVVGGYERVFEVARNFRNEGLSTRHNPEFTALEAYQAFGDVETGMGLTERLVLAAADAATGRRSFATRGGDVDLTPPWPRRELLELLEEALGRPVHPSQPAGDLATLCRDRGIEVDDAWGAGKLVFELYDKVLLPTLLGPVLVCGFPVEVSPLARHRAGDPTLTERFELVVDGREYANGYSELNIPEEQAERFRFEIEAAQRGDPEAHPADLAFVRSLEYGLPPTAGIGIGIDRLVMLLAEVDAIRDVILFPMLRPEASPG